MKTAPYVVAGFTASAALAGSLWLAAQDRELFEVQHATALVDQAGIAFGLDAQEPASARPAAAHQAGPVARKAAQAPSAAQERR